jgi:hypothetical protein
MVAFCAVAMLGACNRHDVPLGGACEVQEDCATGEVLFCVDRPGGGGSVCARPCVIASGPIQASGCQEPGFTCTPMTAAIAGGETELCIPDR